MPAATGYARDCSLLWLGGACSNKCQGYVDLAVTLSVQLTYIVF